MLRARVDVVPVQLLFVVIYADWTTPTKTARRCDGRLYRRT